MTTRTSIDPTRDRQVVPARIGHRGGASRPSRLAATARVLARKALVLVGAALTAPLWILSRLEQRYESETWFSMGAELVSLAPGLPGDFLRRGYYRMTLESFSDDCTVSFGSLFCHRQVRIEKGVYIGGRCMIGMATIEEHATVGSNVDILSGTQQHHFDDLDRPIQEQGGTFEMVRIGRNSWIGNSVVVLADIEANCIIGAGSVVVRPIPERSIAVGNPARVIKTR